RKLSPKGKKCIFIRYSEHSKGYVFLGENAYGTVTALESRDAIFLETDFPCKGHIDRTTIFYEINDPIDETYPTNNMRGQSSSSQSIIPSRSITSSSGLVPQDQQLRKSEHKKIRRRCFDIKGAILMISPNDDEEPRNLQEALSSLAKEN